jgi:hypothetical protein
LLVGLRERAVDRCRQEAGVVVVVDDDVDGDGLIVLNSAGPFSRS